MDPASGLAFLVSTLGLAGLDIYLDTQLLGFRKKYHTDAEWNALDKAGKEAFWKAHLDDVKNLEESSTEEYLRAKRMRAEADALKLEKARNARRNAAFNARLKGFMEYMANGGKVTKQLIETLEAGDLAWNNSLKSLYDSMIRTSRKLVDDRFVTAEFEKAMKKKHKNFSDRASYQARQDEKLIRELYDKKKELRKNFVEKIAIQIAEEEEMRARKAAARGSKTPAVVNEAKSNWSAKKTFFKSSADFVSMFKSMSIGRLMGGLLGFAAAAIIEGIVLEIAWEFGVVLGRYLKDQEKVENLTRKMQEKILFFGDSYTYAQLEQFDMQMEEELEGGTNSESLIGALMTKMIGLVTESAYSNEDVACVKIRQNTNKNNRVSVLANVPNDVRKLYATAYVAGKYEVFVLYNKNNASRSSTCLSRIVYDNATATLYLNFCDGSWYAYYSVSAVEVLGLVNAAKSNLGAYFNKEIRPNYQAYSRGQSPPSGLNSEYMISSQTGAALFRGNDGTYAGNAQRQRSGCWEYLTQEYVDENGKIQFIRIRRWVGNV